MMTCKKNVLWGLALVAATSHAQQSYSVTDMNKRAVPCPEDPQQIGYKHVIDVNVDQRTELEAIAAGNPTPGGYVFPFCNRFKFLMEQEILEVLLPEVTFVCGYNGLQSELCVLEGGNVQVKIPEGSQTNVIFQGMSFSGFTGTSVEAYASSTSKVTFNDAKFETFSNGATAIHQMNPQGGTPMQVEINKAQIENGLAGHLFDNVGGTLVSSELSVIKNVYADSILRTSAGGTSSIAGITATLSDLVVRPFLVYLLEREFWRPLYIQLVCVLFVSLSDLSVTSYFYIHVSKLVVSI